MMHKGAPRGTRTGFTTGACSAAAARAAVIGLVTGQVPDSVECLLPNGDWVTFAVWNRLHQKVQAALESITLEDLYYDARSWQAAQGR